MSKGEHNVEARSVETLEGVAEEGEDALRIDLRCTFIL